MLIDDLPTPSLVVDLDAFDRNVATMAARWPGATLRPHVKAFKSTALARRRSVYNRDQLSVPDPAASWTPTRSSFPGT